MAAHGWPHPAPYPNLGGPLTESGAYPGRTFELAWPQRSPTATDSLGLVAVADSTLAMVSERCHAWKASAVMTTSGARALRPRPGVSTSTSTAVRDPASGLAWSLSRSSLIWRWL